MTVERTVRPMPKTVGALMDLLAKMAKVPNFLDKKDPAGVFLREDTDTFLVDGVGVLVCVEVKPGDSAHVHMTFWDRRLTGREELVRAAADMVMEKHDLQFVWTAIPTYHSKVISFVRRVGFKTIAADRQVTVLRRERRS